MELEITFPGGLRVDASAPGLHVPTDQPARAGGGGEAPTPFALFLSSIGTCAGIYVLHFCRTRGLSTEGIRIRQRLGADRRTGLVSRVELAIEVPTDFPERYHDALVRSANQCAVKRIMEDPPEFHTHVEVTG